MSLYDALCMLLNDTIFFIIIPNIISHFFPFIKYLSISKKLLVLRGLKSKQKKRINFNHVTVILLTVNSFEILPKHGV